MVDQAQLQDMSAEQLRALAMELMSEVRAKDSELRFKEARIAQLTHEMAVLKRWKFAARSEKLAVEQQSLLDEAVDADLIAIEQELEQLAGRPKKDTEPNKPRRAPLPANLPRVEVRHEPASTTCACGCQLKRIGEDVSEKLDYTPGVFTVERHVRGKWVCQQCETPIQSPVPAQVIEHHPHGALLNLLRIPRPGRLLCFAFAFHPSMLLLQPSVKVSYISGAIQSGEHARAFLDDWRGGLVCDDFTGYKALFAQGITELGCMAHARRKFYDLHVANKSQIAQDALNHIGQLYEIEREVQQLAAPSRLEMRQRRAQPIADALHAWMIEQRSRVSEGTAIAKALDYSLRRWAALTRYLDDPQVPIDNNWCENQIRPIAIGRNNWLFAGSLRAGRRAAAVMSLVQSAKMNGHDPYVYLKDVLARLPVHPAARLDELLPQNWKPEPA
ncbi:IS66 family transposase [Burkholderia ubonensis]|uniref:IS66 family transposase n=1 Tax=Burkholderia ubonensis TaxID=101571 RepID=UPI000754D337|nr:IS66 family transposase [Burkholderia ubonensis]KVL18312.1 transposase [Burkholderia ubonensis]KVQ57049.1 transposase [Burkholderia ubonensis]